MKKLFLFCIAAGIQMSAFAQQQTLSPETLWKFGRVAEVTASPDGKTVLYTVKRFDVASDKGNADIYSVAISGGAEKQLTTTPGSEFNIRWRPDGKKIGFLSTESGSVQVWEMNTDGTDKKQVSAIDGDVSGFNYAPTMTYIYFTMDVKTSQTVKDKYPDLPNAKARIMDGLMYKHWDSWEDENSSHVFFAKYSDGKVDAAATDILKGEPYDAPLMPFGGEEQLCWSPDAKWIAYTCKKETGTAYATSTNSDIYVYSIESGKTENLSVGNMGYDIEPRFSPDGKYIAWSSMEKAGFEADRNRIILYDLATKTKKELTVGFDQSAEGLVWSKDSKSIYFGSATKATYQYYVLNLSPAKGQAAIRKITDGQHDLHGLTLAFDGKTTTLVGTRNTISEPAEVIKVNPSNGLIAQLSFANKELLGTLKMGKVEKRMVKATDGKDILTWVIYPPDFDPNKKYPALLYCQGGPQSVVSQFFSYRWNFQLMAANGYIIIAPNRRGLPSFGQEWNDEISGDWGGQAMNDLLSATDEVSKEPYVDKTRLGAVGASYGGYSVYWLAGHHEKRFKTFIAHCGVFNLTSMLGTTEEIFFNNHDMGGPYWANPTPKSYTQFSPHLFVQNWDSPILVIHNERDFRVPLGQGMEAFTAAQLRGIKSRFLYFENEGHWMLKPQNSILWQREFFGWLNETLK